ELINPSSNKSSFSSIVDIVLGVVPTRDLPATPDPAWDPLQPDPATSGVAPYRLYNIGQEQPVELLDFIHALERALGREAKLEMLPLQPGYVPDTEADTRGLVGATG